ncbi:KH domain-containing protein [Nocardioides sp. HDW12B]|nr:KH domain-containing protein [Nocardioides sp. HDW12B]
MSDQTTTQTDDVVDDGVESDDSVETAGSDEATEATETDAPAATSSKVEQLEREGDIAADYLEELLDIADFDGDLDMDVENGRASVSIVGGDLGRLVGERGEVLDALQELTRLAVLRETGDRSRLMLDIGGHRAQRRTELQEVARAAVAEVQASGEPKALEPMNSFERKVVHDVVAEAGLASDSDGVEPRRHVVVRPAEA